MKIDPFGDEPDFGDLLQDKTLFEVFKAAPSFLNTRFNRNVTGLTFLTLSGFAALRIRELPIGPKMAFTETFLSWANVGWTLSATLLGFLIAGFALLATVLRPAAIVHLHMITQDGAKSNMLRELLVFFVEIFIQFLIFLFFCIWVVIVGSKGGPVVEIRDALNSVDHRAASICGYLLYVTWGTWFVALILKLKSFVYNLYQSLVFGMVTAIHAPGQDKPN